jgi:hypothetical protein
VENAENQTAVSRRRFPPRLEIAHGATSTFPQGRRLLSFYERKNKPRKAHALGRSPVNACSNQVEQVITTLVLSAFPLAGFGVTAIGRI